MKTNKCLQKQGITNIKNLEFLIFALIYSLLVVNIFSINIYAQPVKDVNGVTEISLNSKWAEEVFTDKPVIALHNRLEIKREDGPGDTKVNLNTAGGPICISGKTYEHGIGVNSYSIIRVSLAKPAARFTANIGLDDRVASPGIGCSVAFHVSVEGKDVFSTPVLRWSDGMKKIDVSLNGAKTFDLIVDEGGDSRAFDQADWADAKVILQDGSELWLDDLSKEWQLSYGLPFSFVYGGRKSADFIGTWKHEIRQEQIDSSRILRTLTITDPETGLEVKAKCTIYTDCAGVDWTLYFTNKGNTDTPVIEKVEAVDVTLWPGLKNNAPVLHRLKGGGGGVDDWMPFSEQLQTGKRINFAAIYGRSSMGGCPIFNLEWGTAGVITAIGWTGQWDASVHDTSGALRLTAGMQNLHLKLHPGESIRSPRIMQLYWQGGDEARSYNLFRKTMLSHIMPKQNGSPVTPPIVHMGTSFYECDNGTDKDVLSHLESVKDLGFEYFWMDAYYGRDKFPAIGNYVLPLPRAIDLKRFPNGLKPIGEATHNLGMKFVLWFEFERITEGTLMANEHPDWVAPNGVGVLNLGLPEAREYMTNYLNTAIKEYGVDCMRIDNAVFYEGIWKTMDEKAGKDRVGLSEIRYVEGLYKLLDDVLASNPGLFIDNCAAGGGRVDLETCSRSIPLWRTDATIDPLYQHNFNQAAMQNQVMTAGLSRYLPYSTSGQMGVEPYLFRSGFNAGISFAEDVRPANYPKDTLRQAIIEGKRLRKYYSGNFYPLTDVNINPKLWQVNQYHRSKEQDGMIVFFRRHQSPYASYVCNLREIEPGAKYKVIISRSYQQSEPVIMKGIDLQNVKVDVSECPGSVVLEYSKVSD